MSITKSLKRGRALELKIMLDKCVIRRATGGYVTNPDTGVDEPAFEQVYSGPCRLMSAPQTGSETESGQHLFMVEAPRLHLPHDAPVRSGDEAIITETETGNVTLNTPMRLRDLNRGTFRTSQRWNVEVVTG